MRNKNKLLKSIQFFVILCLSMNIVNAENIEYNLLKNSGFESGSSGWDSYGSAVGISQDSYIGSKALEYHTGGTGQATSLLPNIDAIDGRKKYILNGQYKHVGTVDGMWMGLIYFNSNWETIGEIFTELNTTSTYKMFELVATPPDGTNYISFWAWSESDSGGKTLLDDIKLYPEIFAPSPCALLQNGSFEKSLDGWSIYSSETLRVNDAYESNKAIQLLEGGMDQTITLFGDSNDTYQLSGYYKTNGTPSGTWIGMNFYDSRNNLLFTKSIALEESTTYKKFTVNATSLHSTASIQAWVWTEGGIDEGKIILDNLSLTTSSCYDYVIPSSLPPHGMAISDSPQFVVLGFDDNTMSDGINWAINLFNNKYNHDQSSARASFYMNTAGLDEYIEDDPTTLLTAMKALKNGGHEIANHTYDHHQGLSRYTIRRQTLTDWNSSIANGETRLLDTEYLNVLQNDLIGFRSPYLLYNQNTLDVLKSRNYLYDCSIEEGYSKQYDGTNFRWPYQLNEGAPGHNESWYGNPENNSCVSIGAVEGLWELPVYVLMVPKDNECADYGITTGLWSRITQIMPYLSDYKITGFDYNLWHLAKLNKAEVLGILKYNLDLRLKGNRAPLAFGTHTQYYTDAWSFNAPNATTTQMREAISEFLEYALSKPEVRVSPASDVIKWCQNPIALPQN